DPLDGSSGGVRKCEACSGGCQAWPSIPARLQLSNERTHYTRPGPGGPEDVLLYRSKSNRLFASVRGPGGAAAAWSEPAPTDIPDDNANVNAGTLADGRVFLLSNA